MIDKKRWQTLTLAQQFGNIGAELSRARHWEDKGDQHQRNMAFERAFELIDLMIDDLRWRSAVKELTRFREVIADWYSQSHEYDVQPKELEEYCISFSLS